MKSHKEFLEETAKTIMNISLNIEEQLKLATNEKVIVQLNFLKRQYKTNLVVLETMVKN